MKREKGASGLHSDAAPWFLDRSAVHTIKRLTVFFFLLQCCLAPGAHGIEEKVDPRTGLFSLVETDMEVHAGPVMLLVKRWLVPGKNQPGMLGKLWQFQWEKALLKSESMVAVFNAGRLITFHRAGQSAEMFSPTEDRLLLKETGGAAVTWAEGGSAIYDDQGRLLETLDANGNQTTYHYGANGYLTKIEGPEKVFLTLTNDNEGRVLHIQTPTGLSVHYGYEGGNLCEVKINQGAPTKYGYNENGALTRIERPETGSMNITYDAVGRVTSRRWSDGSKESFTYDDASDTVRHMDAAGGITTSLRSHGGLREEITDPLGNKSVATFNQDSLPESFTGPTGATTRYAYDARGRLSELKGCSGAVTRFEYVGNSSRYRSILEPDGTRYDFSYDDKGNLLFLKRNGTVINALTYFPNGLLESAYRLGSPKVSYTYYPDGLVRSITEGPGNTTSYEYDRHGNRIRETDALGRITVWTYNPRNQPSSVTDPAGAKTQYHYDKAGRLTTVTDPGGETTGYRYDDRGRLLSVTDPVGRTTQYGYNPIGRIITETDPAGGVHRYEYDAAGHLINEVNPLGGAITRKYNALGLVVEESDAAGLRVYYEYTDTGLLAAVRNSSGEVTRYTYDQAGRRVTSLSSRGGQTRYEYDSWGRMTKITGPDGYTGRYEYDAAGNLVRETDNHGVDSAYEYDESGRPIREKKAGGYEMSYRYDGLGNLLSRQDSLGGSAHYQYNAQGLLSVVRDSTGASTRYHYDLNGMPIAEINPLGNSTVMVYTPAGEIAEATSAAGDRVRYTYGRDGNLMEIKHPAGGITRIKHDALGNRTEETNPLGAMTRSVYDKAGRLVSRTDPKGQTTAFSYDESGRLMQKRLADGKVISYTYDARGLLTEVTDGSFPVQYAYDPAGRLLEIRYPAVGRRLGYAYDGSGRLSKFTHSEGRTFQYGYNQAGLLSMITPDVGGPITFQYDAKGRLSVVTYPNGVRGSRQYDQEDRPVAITYTDRENQTVCGWHYGYDAAGNLMKVTDEKGKTTTYVYDKDNRLIEEKNASETLNYEYLPGGNRGERHGGGKRIKYTYNKADQLLKAGDETFRYDANGNLIESSGPDGTTRYDYDAEDRLVRAFTPDGQAVRFGYAPTGERLFREDTKGRTSFVTDGTNLLAELDQDLKLKSAYLHGPGIDNPLIMLKDGQMRFYHSDRMGSVAVLTDGNAGTVSRYRTDAFGILQKEEEILPNPFIFTSREYEPALGLYYYRARYYNPQLGRFMSKDPEWSASRLNPYIYALNAPTLYLDPFGLTEQSAVDKLMAQVLRGETRRIRLQAPSWASPEICQRMAEGMLRNRMKDLPPNMTKEQFLQDEHKILVARLKHLKNLLPHQQRNRLLKVQEFRSTLERPTPPPSPAPAHEVAPSPPLEGPRGGGPAGDRGTVKLDAGDRNLRTTIHKPLQPEAITTSSLGSTQTSHPAPVIVQNQPGPAWNPSYRGPTGPNSGLDAGNWKRLSPKPTGGGTPGTEHPGAETVSVPLLQMLVTTEQLIKCREDNIPTRECVVNILKTNAQWAVIQKLALASGSTKAVILLQVVGKGMMYFKLVQDTGNLLYSMADWLAAEYERWDAEERHTRFANVNLAARLDEDLKAMRRRIQQRLEGPAAQKQKACRTLDDMVQKATKSAEEAKKAKAAFPGMKGAIEGWKRSARACEEASQMWTRLKEIRENVERWNKMLKEGLTQAEEVATRCRTVEEADKVRQSIEMAHRTGAGIRQKTEEAEGLAGKLNDMRDDLVSAKARYENALEARDRIIDLANALPTEKALSEAIEKVATSGEVLAGTGSLLNKEIDLLRMGYPDDLKPELAKKFEELKWLVYDYQSKGSCDTEAGRREYNKLAGEVVEIRLTMESTLKPFLDMDRTFMECPTDSPGSILDAIVKVKTDSETVLEESKVLLWLAEECRTGSTKGEAAVPTFVSDSGGIADNYYIYAMTGEGVEPGCLLGIFKGEIKKAGFQLFEGPFQTSESAQASLNKKAQGVKWGHFPVTGGRAYLPYVEFNGEKCAFYPDTRKSQGLSEGTKKGTLQPGAKTNEFWVQVNVKDKDGKSVTGACVREAHSGEAPCALELGGGTYAFGPVRKDPNIPSKTLRLYASMMHRPKNAVVETRVETPAKQVTLGDDSTAFLTLVFPFSVGDEIEKAPSFITGSGGAEPTEKKPSFVSESTTETSTGAPPVSAQPKGTGAQSTKPVKPPSPPPQEPTIQRPQKPQPKDPGPAGPKRKKSYQECVQEFCPMCVFLFGQRPSISGPDDPCERCMKANDANIKRCMGQ